MRFDCIERRICRLFATYGGIVARHPLYFVIIPVIVAACLGGGFAFMKHETDVEYLFTPQNSQARKDQSQLHEDFAGVKDYSPTRSLDLDLVARVIVTHQTNNSVWDPVSLDEIFALDDFIQALVADGNTYQDVCLESAGVCADNGLNLIRTTQDLQYPVHHIPVPGADSIPVFLGYLLGGVSTQDGGGGGGGGGNVLDVAAIHLVYYVNNTDEGRAWAEKFITEVQGRRFSHVKAELWQYYSIEDELAENTARIIPLFSITYTVLITFSILATLLTDPVRSKPWLGVCGVMSAGMAILSGMGFLMYCGLSFVDLVAASPFLVLGIGVDDMFVMLAAWRKTDHYSSTEGRMAEAFSEAAMSITITSVTDVLAVAIGAITPFPAVQRFCAYTGLMLFLDYVFQLTFFAGCMALTGKREVANRHAWTCMKVPPRSEAQDRSPCFLGCCAGGVSRKERNEVVDNTEVLMMTFFRDHFSKIINHVAGKVIILLLTLAYLGVAIWGCTGLNQGLELKNLAPDDSYVADFYKDEETYFAEYDFQVQAVVHAKLDSKEVADRIHELIEELEKSTYFRGKNFTKSWLRDYEDYAAQTGHTIDYSNLFDSHFDLFLSEAAYQGYANDVLEADDVFRFIVMSDFDAGTEAESAMMKKSREIADKFRDLDVVTYSSQFIFTEQYVAVFPNTIQNLAIAVASMLVVSLLLIPHPLVSLWVALSIVSICIGVVGFMSLWEVNLDTVSMVNLIMCIGFCVDFSAHITYAFVTSKMQTRRDRVCDALFALGLPILQGSTSTILAVIPLGLSFAYIFRTFFKVMFLVILFGTLHGLFILPVLLSLLGPSSHDDRGRTNRGTSPVVHAMSETQQQKPPTPPPDYD